MVTIVDYGIGNVNAVANMLRWVGSETVITGNPGQIRIADRIILPGVGAFDPAVRKLTDSGLREALLSALDRGSSVLGICLGAQMLMEGSEEGNLPGLGIIKGYCKRFEKEKVEPLKIPHMAWSDVKFRVDKFGFHGETPRFYFVHSYYMNDVDDDNVLATAVHGHEFVCGIIEGKAVGVQFHPEKSHSFGGRLLSSFAAEN